MLTITTSKATVLAVRLPKHIGNPDRIIVSSLNYLVGSYWSVPKRRILLDEPLPIGSWQPLGFASEISESDMERIVESDISSKNNQRIFRNYKEKIEYYLDPHYFYTVSESFYSLLTKHAISEEHYLLIKID